MVCAAATGRLACMLRQDFWYYLTAAMSSGKIQDFKKRKGGGALVYGDGEWLGERYRDTSHLSRESSKHA